MNIFEIIALLMTLTAVFSYVNYRLIRLPTPIGLMLISLLFSLALIFSEYLGFGLKARAAEFMSQIDFNQTLMRGMLSFLLFAGALHKCGTSNLHTPGEKGIQSARNKDSHMGWSSRGDLGGAGSLPLRLTGTRFDFDRDLCRRRLLNLGPGAYGAGFVANSCSARKRSRTFRRSSSPSCARWRRGCGLVPP